MKCQHHQFVFTSPYLPQSKSRILYITHHLLWNYTIMYLRKHNILYLRKSVLLRIYLMINLLQLLVLISRMPYLVTVPV
jgi:hypothetical protein